MGNNTKKNIFTFERVVTVLTLIGIVGGVFYKIGAWETKLEGSTTKIITLNTKIDGLKGTITKLSEKIILMDKELYGLGLKVGFIKEADANYKKKVQTSSPTTTLTVDFSEKQEGAK